MLIVEIIVSAGRTFNHPFESYSNLRPQITLKASLNEGDDADKAAQLLQAKAEKLVEDHKNNMLKAIQELAELQEAQQRIASLGEALRRNQEELERIRNRWPELPCWLSLPNPQEQE